MLTHKGTQTIETDRLILRRAILEDAEPMFRNWASDPEVTKYLTWHLTKVLRLHRRSWRVGCLNTDAAITTTG